MKRNTLSFVSFLLLVVISFTACQEDESAKEVKALQEEFDATMKKTIAVHDEVMPKMGEINKLLDKLEEQKDLMAEEEYLEANDQLQKAYKGMMTWMKDLSETFDKEEINSGIKEEDKAILKEKNEKLEKLKEDAEIMKERILSSIALGNQLMLQNQ